MNDFEVEQTRKSNLWKERNYFVYTSRKKKIHSKGSKYMWPTVVFIPIIQLAIIQ